MAATVQQHCDPLVQALEAYAPKVAPAVACGGKHISLYDICTDDAARDELTAIVTDVRKAGRPCDGCGGALDSNFRIHVKWAIAPATLAMVYKTSQALCSACYSLTDLPAMSARLSLQNTSDETEQLVARFLQVNGHGAQATAQAISLAHECFAIAYSLRVLTRGVPPRLTDESGEAVSAETLLRTARATLAPKKKAAAPKAEGAQTPAKKSKKDAKAQTPAPAEARKPADAKKRRRTMD